MQAIKAMLEAGMHMETDWFPLTIWFQIYN